MSLREKINSDYIEAYKKRDEQKIAILRLILSSVKNREIETKKEASDEDVTKVINKEIKQRLETILGLKKAERSNDALKEEKSINYLKSYLPEELNENQVRGLVNESISEINATDIKDLGKVISLAMKKSGGKAGGAIVSRIAKEELS